MILAPLGVKIFAPLGVMKIAHPAYSMFFRDIETTYFNFH